MNAQGMRPNHMNLDFTPDWSVLAYAMILALIGTLTFIIVPAVRTWRRELLPFFADGRTRDLLAAKLQREHLLIRGYALSGDFLSR